MDSSSKQQTSPSKNWLIRTKQRQILGPVSKQKLISFVEKGALGPEDEVMSGNGYWFALKEKDLLDKYVLGDIPQSFDPISEAKTVLSVPQERREGTASLHPNPDPLKLKREQMAKETFEISGEDEIRLPDEDDLAYPNLGDGAEEVTPSPENLEYPDFDDVSAVDEPQTQVLKLDSSFTEQKASEENRSSLIDEVENENEDISSLSDQGDDWDGELPAEDDLAYPELGSESPDKETAKEETVEDEVDPPPSSFPEPSENLEPEVKKKKKKSMKKPKKVVEAPKRNDRYLFYILALVVLLTLSVFYYYRKILNKPLPLIGLVMADVQAQSLVQDPSGLKKKEFFGLFLSPKSSTEQELT